MLSTAKYFHTLMALENLEPRRLLAAISSGQMVTASLINEGEKDKYTFSASAGGSIVAAMGPTTPLGSSLLSRIEIFDPAGKSLGFSTASVFPDSAGLTVVAPTTGTYTAVASSDAFGGTYNLAVASLPGSLVQDADGGTVVSGEATNGNLDGALDAFAISAKAGGSIVVSMGPANALGSNFLSRVQLFDPKGKAVGAATAVVFASYTTLTATATMNGTYYIVASAPSGYNGEYRLAVASVPAPQYSDSDGGAIQSGQTLNGSLNGELDAFALAANPGDNLSVTMAPALTFGSTAQSRVQLFDPSGKLVRTVTASVFASSAALATTATVGGTYYVVASVASGYALDYTLKLTIKPSSTNSLSGSLFNDVDADNSKDPGEGALSGWKVFLDADKDGVLDAGEKTAATDAAGNYKFTGLAAGSYRVREVINSGWRRTAPSSGYHDVTLTAGQNVTARNFGNTQKVLVSGTLFNDSDSDGVKDSGEVGLVNWKVYLDADKDGALDSTEKYVVTDAAGNYNFKTLSSGSYRVRLVSPTGWRRTTPSSGYFDLTLASGGSATGKNLGNTQKVLISGTVFNDLDGDRIKDSGEAGLSGWKVFIDSDGDGIWDGTEKYVTTDASGNWSFKTLSAGSYKVRVVQRTGWKLTTPSATPYYGITLSSGGSSTGKLFGEKKA